MQSPPAQAWTSSGGTVGSRLLWLSVLRPLRDLGEFGLWKRPQRAS